VTIRVAQLPNFSAYIQMSFLPSKPSSFLVRPTSFGSAVPAETAFKPTDESKPSEPAHVSNKPKWTDYVKSVYAKLQGDDPETTFKQAMSHAKATYKK